MLIEPLTRVEDDSILEQIKGVLVTGTEQTIGFDESGKPLSQQALEKTIQEAEKRVAAGNSLTQAQVEEEAKHWWWRMHIRLFGILRLRKLYKLS